ncbi:indolepyruvate ferredoxin oxidoreductase subunit alpha [Patescibacteria group bacterium]|nr:indolepyruvate ferredoxin oxidoreductase subunit alpha [Patescibacteria group bacterium]
MKKILLGNEAIVQGALEAGVDFVSGYPGCPSAEVGDGFKDIAKEKGIYAEWSTNEKVALEVAIGASFSGLKTLVNMKSFGVNVCSDSLLPLAYTGTKGPMVIFIGDDPSCHSSAQSEQDSRGYAYLSRIPILDPSDPQECCDFTKLGFEISEKFNIPVILRTTTRVSHQKMPVTINSKSQILNPKQISNPKSKIPKGVFIKNPHQFCTMPPRVLEMKKELLQKIEKIRQFAEKSKINKVIGKKNKIGIIASSISYLHILEALKTLGIQLPVLKLGFFYPLPEKMITDFIKGKKKILVVEELDPYLENEIVRLAKDKLTIYGKDVLPTVGELDTDKVCIALSKITGKKFVIEKSKILDLPKRSARLCEGCPYWYILPIIKKVATEGTIFGGDIGCNMIAGLSPHNMQDYLFSMGAGLGISHGVGKATDQKVISIMGDGTFFHSGIPALINTVYNKSSPLIVVLDNRITAMTGHQVNPGMGKTLMGENTEELKIEEIAKACGVKHIKVLDPINIKELEEAVKEFLIKKEVSLIVCRRICALLLKKQNG